MKSRFAAEQLFSRILLALFPLADPAGGSSAGIGDEESASKIGDGNFLLSCVHLRTSDVYLLVKEGGRM